MISLWKSLKFYTNTRSRNFPNLYHLNLKSQIFTLSRDFFIIKNLREKQFIAFILVFILTKLKSPSKKAEPCSTFLKYYFVLSFYSSYKFK